MRAQRRYINAVEKTDRTWTTVCHLSPLVLMLGIPMTNVLTPLIIWFISKQHSPGADRHGRAVLNFQLSMTLYFFVLLIISKLPYMTEPGAVCLRVWVYINIFFILRATYTATQGELFKFPFSIRFIPE